MKLPGHNRNEALDCRNYANAAYRALNPPLEKLFNRLHDIKPKREPVRADKRMQNRNGNRDINYDW